MNTALNSGRQTVSSWYIDSHLQSQYFTTRYSMMRFFIQPLVLAAACASLSQAISIGRAGEGESLTLAKRSCGRFQETCSTGQTYLIALVDGDTSLYSTRCEDGNGGYTKSNVNLGDCLNNNFGSLGPGGG